MGLPRSKYVKEGEEGIYHCFARCVRRAYLYGYDTVTQRDFSHRRAWIVDRMRFLAGIFAIDVCAYAIMANHYHNVIRTRPDLVAAWSDREVAERWVTLCPRKPRSRKKPAPSIEDQVNALMASPHRIAQLRTRLSSISWFMGRLNEFIARAANAEDGVKGRFGESRFKCQALLDDAALIACMVYVDLNPIRAGVAATPEDSDFTSIQERIRAWRQQQAKTSADCQSASCPPEACSTTADSKASTDAAENELPDESWLCPIVSDRQRRGFLTMPDSEYFNLLDRSGRIVRLDKRGAMHPDLAPILSRIGARPETWADTITQFGSSFRLAAGSPASLKHFAKKIGVHWLFGASRAKASFT